MLPESCSIHVISAPAASRNSRTSVRQYQKAPARSARAPRSALLVASLLRCLRGRMSASERPLSVPPKWNAATGWTERGGRLHEPRRSKDHRSEATRTATSRGSAACRGFLTGFGFYHRYQFEHDPPYNSFMVASSKKASLWMRSSSVNSGWNEVPTTGPSRTATGRPSHSASTSASPTDSMSGARMNTAW